jgi:hypothetical protein
MDVAGKAAAGKSAEPSRSVPSPVQAFELSQRSDSVRPGNLAENPGNELRTAEPRTVIVDKKLVDEAAEWISAKIAATLRRGAEDVGDYVLNTFFLGDPEFARSKNPNKNASYRALVEKCGTSALPVSKTWLNNAVGIALINRSLPQSASAFRALPSSFQQALLPLRDPDEVEKVAKVAASTALTCRELREMVAMRLSRVAPTSSKERAGTPTILKKLRKPTMTFRSQHGVDWFSEAEIVEMDVAQKGCALRSAESLIENLTALVRRLKGA